MARIIRKMAGFIMAPFACPNCRRLVHFEARICPECRATLGYDPGENAFLFLADDATRWRNGAGDAVDAVVCANNTDHAICNWLVRVDEAQALCRACRHNEVIPDLNIQGVAQRWAKIEAAKRRMIHSLLQLGLPVETPAEAPDGEQGFVFHFLYDPAAENGADAQVMTGHDGGTITLNLVEADDAMRQRIRENMGEPYRTLLGHFRHEIGHHYWNRLVEHDPQRLEEFRALFGDELADYEQALAAHYSADPAQVWSDDFISFYATSHPWEDFAETFAHYLHIVDVLATGAGIGLSVESDLDVRLDFDPYRAGAGQLAGAMAPLSFAMNTINRAMGQPDCYPFHLTDRIVAKLDFIQRLTPG